MANPLLLRLAFALFTSLIIIGLSDNVNAQSKRVLLNSDGSQVNGSLQSDARLNTLVKDLHPSVHLTEGVIKVREASPTTLFTDLISISSIKELAFPVSKIEVVTILVDDLGQLTSTVDMNIFSGFERLKYVHVQSSIECGTNDLFKMLKNVGSQYKILITVERPS